MVLNHPTQTSRGATLIEVVVATVVVATIITAIAATLTMSLRNTARSQAKIVATDAAQKALETFRREKSKLGWDSFVTALDSGTYCLDTLPSTTEEFVALSPGECGEGELVSGTQLTREAVVSSSADSVQVTIRVTWLEGGRISTRNQEISVTQTYQSWE